MPAIAKTRVRAKAGAAVMWSAEELKLLILDDPAILRTADPRKRLALLTERMKKVLPAERWRPAHSLYVCCVDMPSQFDKLVAKARTNKPLSRNTLKRRAAKASETTQPDPVATARTEPDPAPVAAPAKARKLRIVTNAGTPIPEPEKEPVAVATTASPAERQANDDTLLADAVLGAALRDILTAAVGAGLSTAIDAAVRANMQTCVDAALKSVKLPTRESLLGDMEEMLTRLLGGPTTAQPPAPEPVATISPIKLPEAPIEVAPPDEEAPPVSVIPVPAPEPKSKPIEVQPKDAAPHDLTEQLEFAAKALGMPQVKRPSVVVCGLHPKVFEELERYHGRAYRFTYVKQDHFNAASDLPASAEALILCRKKLSHELAQAVRRYAVPTKSVANSLPAAEWALKEIFA